MKNKKFWVSLLAGILAAVMILSLVLSVLPSVRAESSSEIQSQINALKEEKKQQDAKIKELEKQMAANVSEIKDIVRQKQLIEQQISLMYEQVENINDQVASYALMIADMQEQLDAAQERLEALNKKNKERIRAMEEDGALSYWTVLFQANDFYDLLDRLNMMQEIAASDSRRLKEMRDAAKVVQETKTNLLTEKTALQQSKDELQSTEAGLKAKIEDANNLLLDLEKKGDDYSNLLWEMEQQEAETLKQLAQKEKDYDAAKKHEEYLAWLATSVSTTTAPPTKPAGSGNTGGTGGIPTVDQTGTSWLVPTSYIKLTSPFGMRFHPIHHQWLMHYGVDLAGREGWDVVATRGGVVREVGYDKASAGNYVIIDHLDGFESIYMHMYRWPEVSVGQYVAQGQKIGGQGTTGGSTGVHLHFGISYNGVYVNPAEYVKLK
ncbi:MAG: peptidoglycan DD-metalloendopeptidase family protein [Oscillospiraceae bacterium]|nr:peptidoglycan DD-metalloendopeptidase family protein [Oscillospiraceae bacterium]